MKRLKKILLSLFLTVLFFATLTGIGALVYHFPYVCMGIVILGIAITVYALIFSSVEHYDDDDEGWLG